MDNHSRSEPVIFFFFSRDSGIDGVMVPVKVLQENPT